MASSNPDDPNKPVTGHPSSEPEVATGYPLSSAYFYIPPPPSPHFPALHRPHHHHNHRSQSSLLCRLSAALLSLSLLLAAFLSITFLLLLLRPLLPSFRLASASASASFSPLLNSTANDGVWNLLIQVTNPNSKIDILYDRLETSILYKVEFLTARTEFLPFDQGKGDQTLLNAQLRNVGATSPDVLKAIGEERSGVVSYGVRVWGLVSFRSGGGWRTRKRLMRVFCYGVEIGYDGSGGGPGRLVNPWKECKVEI